MIWYRHWLELRSTVLMLLTAALVLGPLYLRSELIDPRPAFRPDLYFGPLARLAPSLDTQQIAAIAHHEEVMWFAILFASYIVAGDGLRVLDRFRGAFVSGALHFTLSLPISRHRIVITRIAAGYAIAAIALATSVAANGFVIAASDETVPIIPMLAASAFASLVILFWICVVTTLLTFAGANWGVVLTLFGMLFTSPLSMYGMSAAAAHSLEWPLWALFGVLLVGALYLTTTIVADQET